MLVFLLSILVVGKSSTIDCDGLDTKCQMECNTLRNDFTHKCTLTLVTSCPVGCKASYESLLAYGSQTEPHFGQQYADCNCSHSDASFCPTRNATLQKCNITAGTILPTPTAANNSSSRSGTGGTPSVNSSTLHTSGAMQLQMLLNVQILLLQTWLL